jgi:hypothetical protein
MTDNLQGRTLAHLKCHSGDINDGEKNKNENNNASNNKLPFPRMSDTDEKRQFNLLTERKANINTRK